MEEEIEILGVGSRVKHPAYGDGVVTKVNVVAYEVCFILYGLKNVGKSYKDWEVIDLVPNSEKVTFNEMEKSLIKVLKTWSDISEITPIGDKWKGGTLVIKPEDPDLKPKEIPIDTFFHKIVMVRDRIRVMEQRINSSKMLGEDDKINLQQYITRIYGSLTTFNVLFKYKEDHFKGERSK